MEARRHFLAESRAGVFSLVGDYEPAFFDLQSGFRCGR
jgi:hypothetical protein